MGKNINIWTKVTHTFNKLLFYNLKKNKWIRKTSKPHIKNTHNSYCSEDTCSCISPSYRGHLHVFLLKSLRCHCWVPRVNAHACLQRLASSHCQIGRFLEARFFFFTIASPIEKRFLILSACVVSPFTFHSNKRKLLRDY